MDTTKTPPVPITEKMLLDWGGPRVFRDGRALYDDGVVHHVEYEPPVVRGELTYGNRLMPCQFVMQGDGSVDNRCPCRDSRERGIICVHVIALGLELVRRRSDPERERRAREERRRAERLARIQDEAYVHRAPPGTGGAISARLEFTLGADWRRTAKTGTVPLACLFRYAKQAVSVDAVPKDVVLALRPQDENLLFVLEDISGGPARSCLMVALSDFLNLLDLHKGKPLLEEGRAAAITVNAATMETVLRMDLDRATGELILQAHTELPFMDAGALPTYLVEGRSGWICDAGQLWPLANLLPLPLRGIYAKPVCVARDSVPRFLQTELPLLEKRVRLLTDLTPDLFTIEPAEPAFRLQVRGSPASLAATLYADYPCVSLVAARPDSRGGFAIPDPDDLLRYTVRNLDREYVALRRLAATGFEGGHGDALSHIIGTREVLNFLGRSLPQLRRHGWQVELEGRVQPFFEAAEFATPVVRIEPTGPTGVFEVGFAYEDGHGQSLSEAEIQRALLKGESYVEKGNRTILLDGDAIETARGVFADCASGEGRGPGTFRMDGIYAAYVQSSLDALDGIDVESNPAWRDRARAQNRGAPLRPVSLPGPLEKVLREYQKEGVSWLRFLEENGCCGILADEMGLGKTLQTLVWLRLARADPAAAGKPALIVCPTSLVENWAEEAQRFVPGLAILILSGGERHERWEEIADSDLAITSYALMRKDIARYIAIEFSSVVLDEAQHIKNRSTQNAVAAKRLRALHRLVLTGTPIENSVSDLWSIMDFLMPGYLGTHETFRNHYELPIQQGGSDGDGAQARLRRKLHPFLLRRLKKDVARDLPPKIERLASCSLSRDQQLVYHELLESSRRRLADMVSRQGFQRSRMQILKTLLRLRQVCCHLDLLKLADLQSKFPSAKMALFFELLDEAMDGGHRVLVFSQFTSMLAILRREMEARELRFCYLDGSTKERLTVVKTFNTERAIPAFLISLKAGGTGLNLTGADMVIHFDPWWNPAVEDQATDRAYRIGQERTVYSVKLITRGTVEEKVLAMQKRKQAVIDATLGRDKNGLGRLTWEDVQELLNT